MKVHQYTDHLPLFRNAVITIGTFDGVHQGHRQIISSLQQEAAAAGGETVIITFHPHPRWVLRNHDIQLINTIDERIELLRQAGIDHLVIVPFTDAFSKLSAEEYVEHFLVEHFHPHTIIIGYDHRFGNNRKGDFRMLEAYAARGLFRLKEIPEHVINDNTVSSTTIRHSVLQGHIQEANRLLGYPFFFTGEVVEGNKLGRTIGYPTANIHIKEPEKLIPANGVYAVTAELMNEKGRLYQGMMNIGLRPTVGGKNRTIEVNLFGFQRDIYHQPIRVYVYRYLRDEVKFNGLDALKDQLALDRQDTLAALSEISS